MEDQPHATAFTSVDKTPKPRFARSLYEMASALSMSSIERPLVSILTA